VYEELIGLILSMLGVDHSLSRPFEEAEMTGG